MKHETVQQKEKSHQFLSSWLSWANRNPDDLPFYLLNLGILGEWFGSHLYCMYLCLLLVWAIPAKMPLLVTLETSPFVPLLLLHCVDLHWLSCSSIRYPSSHRVVPFIIASYFAHQGTCRTTCSVLIATGGGNLFLVP